MQINEASIIAALLCASALMLTVHLFRKQIMALGKGIAAFLIISGLCIIRMILPVELPPIEERHRIIDIPEESRQMMFDETKREFINECGIANGDTTRRTEVFAEYQRNAKKRDRLKGTWTLEQYERMYRQSLGDQKPQLFLTYLTALVPA